MLLGKGMIAKKKDQRTVGAGRAGYGLKNNFWFHLYIMKIIPDLLVFFLEINFLKQQKKC